MNDKFDFFLFELKPYYSNRNGDEERDKFCSGNPLFKCMSLLIRASLVSVHVYLCISEFVLDLFPYIQ